MEILCSPEKFKKCKKNHLCHLCDGERLYTPPKPFKPIRRGPRKPKEGMEFEKRVAKKYNKTIKQNNWQSTARRRPNSGAFWSLPGDIVTKDALFEAKERGTKNSKGEKTITVHKEWMEKVKRETYEQTSKHYWFLPFGFKNDDEIYVITSFDIQLQLISLLHDQEEIIQELQQKLEKEDK